MEQEIDQYDEYFNKIIEQIGITRETWEISNELYLQDAKEQQELQRLEKKIHEHLPQPTLPKSLSKRKAKEILLDVNNRAKTIFKKMQGMISCPEIEPLIIETIAYDLAFLEYGFQENIFRYAVYTYELQNDLDVQMFLDDLETSL